jgi:hypothetical protein
VPIVANIHNIFHGWHNLMLKGFLLFGCVADNTSGGGNSAGTYKWASAFHPKHCFAQAMVTHSALTCGKEPVSLKIYK